MFIESLCVYGGFTGNGIAGDLLEINLSSGNAEAAGDVTISWNSLIILTLYLYRF